MLCSWLFWWHRRQRELVSAGEASLKVKIFVLSPPPSTCAFPGPWHASQPSHPVYPRQHGQNRCSATDSDEQGDAAARGEAEAVAVCGRTKVFTLGESLGGVESLIEHPARMTHASVAESPLAVPGDLIRLSVGIESADDLLEDLRSALG